MTGAAGVAAMGRSSCTCKAWKQSVTCKANGLGWLWMRHGLSRRGKATGVSLQELLKPH